MKEEWKIVEDFPNYEVSNIGFVRNKNTGQILKPEKNQQGYYRVTLYNDGSPYHLSIHRLVAIAFIPNPNNLPQVNHKDEEKLNNMVDNLEWCDNSYNMNYGTRNERIGKKRAIPVFQCDDDGKIIARWDSAGEAAEHIKGTRQAICDCCLGKRKHHKGFVWRYVEQDCGTNP